jgi:hypothetical protein
LGSLGPSLNKNFRLTSDTIGEAFLSASHMSGERVTIYTDGTTTEIDGTGHLHIRREVILNPRSTTRTVFTYCRHYPRHLFDENEARPRETITVQRLLTTNQS